MATQGDISYSLAIGAGQAVRRNAGNTAFEAVTPLTLTGGGGTPTIAAGAAAGTSPTISITGTTAGGKITLTTGTSLPTGVLLTVTFPTTFTNAPYVQFSPANQNAATVQMSAAIYVSTGTGSFDFTQPTIAGLGPSTQYIWYYSVISS